MTLENQREILHSNGIRPLSRKNPQKKRHAMPNQKGREESGVEVAVVVFAAKIPIDRNTQRLSEA